MRYPAGPKMRAKRDNVGCVFRCASFTPNFSSLWCMSNLVATIINQFQCQIIMDYDTEIDRRLAALDHETEDEMGVEAGDEDEKECSENSTPEEMRNRFRHFTSYNKSEAVAHTDSDDESAERVESTSTLSTPNFFFSHTKTWAIFSVSFPAFSSCWKALLVCHKNGKAFSMKFGHYWIFEFTKKTQPFNISTRLIVWLCVMYKALCVMTKQTQTPLSWSAKSYQDYNHHGER